MVGCRCMYIYITCTQVKVYIYILYYIHGAASQPKEKDTTGTINKLFKRLRQRHQSLFSAAGCAGGVRCARGARGGGNLTLLAVYTYIYTRSVFLGARVFLFIFHGGLI